MGKVIFKVSGAIFSGTFKDGKQSVKLRDSNYWSGALLDYPLVSENSIKGAVLRSLGCSASVKDLYKSKSDDVRKLIDCAERTAATAKVRIESVGYNTTVMRSRRPGNAMSVPEGHMLRVRPHHLRAMFRENISAISKLWPEVLVSGEFSTRKFLEKHTEAKNGNKIMKFVAKTTSDSEKNKLANITDFINNATPNPGMESDLDTAKSYLIQIRDEISRHDIASESEWGDAFLRNGGKSIIDYGTLEILQLFAAIIGGVCIDKEQLDDSPVTPMTGSSMRCLIPYAQMESNDRPMYIVDIEYSLLLDLGDYAEAAILGPNPHLSVKGHVEKRPAEVEEERWHDIPVKEFTMRKCKELFGSSINIKISNKNWETKNVQDSIQDSEQ